MLRAKYKSLKTELLIVFSIGFMIAISSLVIFSNITYKKKILSTTKLELNNLANNYSLKTSSYINQGLNAVEFISQSISLLINNKDFNSVKYVESDKLLRELLFKYNNFSDAFMIWEKEKQNSNELKLSNTYSFDSSGRYISLWKKNREYEINKITTINAKQSILYNQYYNITKKNRHLTIIEPFIHRYKGKETVKITIIAPIIKNSKFMGVMGINLSLNNLKNIISNIELNKTHSLVTILSKQNNIIAISEKQYLVGKHIDEILSLSKVINEKIKDNKNYLKYADEKIEVCKNILINKDLNWKILITIQMEQIMDDENDILYYQIIFGIIMMIISELVLFAYTTNILVPIKSLVKYSNRIALGDIKVLEKNIAKDEIGQLHRAFNSIAIFLRQIDTVSKSISAGDFSKVVEIHDTKNTIGTSINKMNIALKVAKDKEEKQKAETVKSDWIRLGLSKMNNIISKNTNNIDELTEKIIFELVNFLDASIGGIYLIKNNSKGKPYLEIASAIAYDKKKYINKKIKLGEGLIGACVIEKKLINIKKIPNDYIKITSGLGGLAPRTLLIFPLVFNDTVLGVIEIASMSKFNELKLDFVNQISINIATALSTARINSKTTELLKQSQQHSKELSDKEKEMLLSFEKLRKTQENAVKREFESNALLDAINNTLLTIEYTIDGVLLDANKKYLSVMDYSIDELKGVNVLDLLYEEDRDELQNVIENVKLGKFYENEMKRYTKYGKLKWLWSTYTPVYNSNGEISKILYFAIDITENKKEREELIKKEKELNNKIKNYEISQSELNELHNNQQEKISNLINEYQKIQEELSKVYESQKISDAIMAEDYENHIVEMYISWKKQLSRVEEIFKENNLLK